MASIDTTRGRAGRSLLKIGIVMILVGVITFGPPGTPVAYAHGGFPHGVQNCDFFPLEDERADGGWKIGIGSASTPPSPGSTEASGVASGDISWNIKSSADNPVVYASTSWTGYYFNYSYTGSGYTLYGTRIRVTGSNRTEDGALFTSTNSGSIQIPNGTAHIAFCFDSGGTTTTTTTTVPATTTTTVPATTTTTSTSTTTTTVPVTTTTTSTSTTTTTVPATTTTTVPATTTTTSTSTTTTTVPATTTTTSTSTTTTTVPATTTTTSTSTTTTTVPATTTTTVPATTTTTVPATTTTTVPATTTTTVPATTTTTSTTTTTIGGASTTTTTVPETTTTTLGTTTTTTQGTTTTTIGGPSTTTTTAGSPTSTTAGTSTTTIGASCDPNDPDCLPNMGAGNLMSLLLASIGLLFAGVGFVSTADERRKVLGVR